MERLSEVLEMQSTCQDSNLIATTHYTDFSQGPPLRSHKSQSLARKTYSAASMVSQIHLTHLCSISSLLIFLKAVFLLIYFEDEHFQVNRLLIKKWKIPQLVSRQSLRISINASHVSVPQNIILYNFWNHDLFISGRFFIVVPRCYQVLL